MNQDAIATRQPDRPTIDPCELFGIPPGSVIATEQIVYGREVGHLLEEGHENRWVLIKGEEIVGIWDTQEEALHELHKHYPRQRCIVKQILANEPPIRLSWRAQQCLK